MPKHVVINCEADRHQLEVAIAALREKQCRMPDHWLERRAEIGAEIDELVDLWLKAPA